MKSSLPGTPPPLWSECPLTGCNSAMTCCHPKACDSRLRRAAATPRQHELKCWPQYFEAVIDGRKPFEIRRNDRLFSVGDTLWLREWDPKTEAYSGCDCYRTVTFLTTHEQQPDFVVMGIARSETEPQIKRIH